MKARTRSLLHETFETGITLKGIDGVLEVIGGILIWFVTPSSLNRITRVLFQHELSRDPRDFIVSHLLNASQNLTSGNRLFAALFLLSHGLTKIVLVIALWLNRLWAYPLIILVFGAFSVYQVYGFTHTHSVWLALLTVFDILIVCLTWGNIRSKGQCRPSAAISDSARFGTRVSGTDYRRPALAGANCARCF